MQYGIINSDSIAYLNKHWAGTFKAPSDVALAIALAMPSVSEGGVRSQRGGLKAPGFATYYHACALSWGDGNVHAGCVDLDFFKVQAAAGGQASNKTNHLKWLAQAGLVVNHRVNGVRYSALTEAGLAQVKAVSPELAKLAKAYTAEARNKAVKAEAKVANEPPKAVRKAKQKAMGDRLEASKAAVAANEALVTHVAGDTFAVEAEPVNVDVATAQAIISDLANL